MNTKPLFTIITPVRNGADVLKNTINSVLEQVPSLYEYLVQDGASTDGTQDILNLYAGQLSFVSEPDGGVYDAMNRALARARGRFIYFLGAGDILRPSMLEEVAAVIQKETGGQSGDDRPLMLYGNVFSHSRGRVFDGYFTRWKLSRLNLPHQAMFVERHCFDELGPFDVRFPIMADYAWNIKAFGTNHIRKVYMPLVIADYGAGGISGQRPDTVFIAARLELIHANLGIGPYIFNKTASLLPSGIKEARYQAFQRARQWLGLPRNY